MDLFPISREEKAAAAEREVRQRRRMYPRLIAKGDMSQEFADKQIKIMEAIHADYVAENPLEVFVRQISRFTTDGEITCADAEARVRELESAISVAFHSLYEGMGDAILALQGPAGAEVTREELGQYFTDKRGRKAGGCFSPPQVDGCDDARPCWCKNWGLKKAATLLSQFTLHRRPPSQDTTGEG